MAVVKPIVSLTRTITTLTTAVDALSADVGELTAKNSQTHGRIFERLDEQGEKIQNHEYRITRIEEG